MPSQLEVLRGEFPHWTFLYFFQTSESEEEGYMILASRNGDGLLVGGLTTEEVRRKINREGVLPHRRGI